MQNFSGNSPVADAFRRHAHSHIFTLFKVIFGGENFNINLTGFYANEFREYECVLYIIYLVS